MGKYVKWFKPSAQPMEEEKLRRLSLKELRRIVFRNRTGLSPIGRIATAQNTTLALRIIQERKG